MTDHERHREALGAYVVGALAPSERAEVDEHLSRCPECREFLAELAVLPGLLARLKPDEVEAATLSMSDVGTAQAAAVVSQQRRIERRRLRMWRATAAAAAIVAVIALAAALFPVPRGEGDLYVARPVAAGAERVTGEAVVQERGWGMVVELDLRSLPRERGFVLWAIGTEDRRVRAASWRAVDDRTVRLTGSCYLNASEVVRLEVTTPDEELLLTLERPTEGVVG